MLRKILLSGLLQATSIFTLVAQDTLTSFYDANWKETTKTEAVYYRKYFLVEDSQWRVFDYYLSGQMQMKGTYLEKELETKVGDFTYFYEDGSVSTESKYSNEGTLITSRSHYENGKLESESYTNNGKDSLYQYYEDGGLELISEMKDGLQHGFCTYYHPNGKKASEGRFTEGSRYGEWKYYDEDGEYLDNEFLAPKITLPCDFTIDFLGESWLNLKKDEPTEINDNFSADLYMRRKTTDKKGNPVLLMCTALCIFSEDGSSAASARDISAAVMKNKKGKSKARLVKEYNGDRLDLNNGILYYFVDKSGKKKLNTYFYTKVVGDKILELFFQYDPKMDEDYIPIIFEIISNIKYKERKAAVK